MFEMKVGAARLSTARQSEDRTLTTKQGIVPMRAATARGVRVGRKALRRLSGRRSAFDVKRKKVKGKSERRIVRLQLLPFIFFLLP
jgi:hypothetical protein